MSGIDRHILVIDDDTLVRQSIAVYLEDSGFRVTQADCGQAGIELLKTQTPDLIVTDLRMPGMDGLDVLRHVKEQHSDIAVIVVSGMGVVRDVVDALRLGASDYLVKPLVDIEVLVHAIGRALEHADLRRENEGYREKLEQVNTDQQEVIGILERDQKAGREIQRRFLPPAPAVMQGYHLDYKILPSLFLSGDFVDYGLLGGRYLAFYLADVAGHGAAPAFITIWLKELVRRIFREHKLFSEEENFKSDISKMLKLINSDVLESKLGSHLTCFVGVIDTQTNKMHYAIGGHLPLPVLISDTGVSYLEGKGKPIGIFDEVDWPVYAIGLPDKFSLVAFSDGVLEILPEGSLIEKEAALLSRLDGLTGGIDDIYRRLELHESDTPPDDVAVMKIQFE